MPNSTVTASLRYLISNDDKPVYRASAGGVDDNHDRGVELESRTVTIHDARGLKPPATLDRQGFSLMTQRTAIIDFYALDAHRQHYEQAVTDLVLAATGGGDAVVFDHTLRSGSAQIRGLRTTREPADFIHNDYTAASARKRLVDLPPNGEARRRLAKRFAIVNVWRSINGTVWNHPITCCDATTIAPGDMVPVERRARDRVGEVELVTWNPAHRWYYFPAMTMDEALLIKTFDAADDGRATRSIHTAFDNPLAPENAPARESIESRVMIFFE